MNAFRRFVIVSLALLHGGCDQNVTQHGPVVRVSDGSDSRIVFATGLSSSADPRQAAIEAASQAKAELAGQRPQLVLVFDRADDHEAMCQEVGEVFDQQLIYGCSSYGPITDHGNEGTVGVLAIAGGVDVAIASAPVNKDHQACGRAIGDAIQQANLPDSPGRVMILFGSCHVPANDRLVQGVRSVLGDTFPIAGGASSAGEFIYRQGEVVHGVNLGILICGDFSFGLSTQGEQQKQGILATAQSAVADAMKPTANQADVVFTFGCGGRKDVLGTDLSEELTAIRSASGNAALFGFYGSGEIGPPITGQPARGVGFELAVCAIKNNTNTAHE